MKTLNKTTDEKIDALLATLEAISGVKEMVSDEEKEAIKLAKRVSMTVEEYVDTNRQMIDNTNSFMARYKANGFGIWPDLWPENLRGMNEDVRSKVSFFQIPKSVRMYNQLEICSQLENAKAAIHAIN